MIGYASFLGQVRLARRSGLGQEVPMRGRLEWAQMVGQIQGALAGRPDCDLEGKYKAVLERSVSWLNSSPEEGAVFTLTDEEKAIQKAFNDCINRAPSTQPLPTPGPVEAKPYEPAIPTWGYVVGGLAAVGLIALIATR